MEDSAPVKNPLSIPVAIVIAGAFIALAVYFSRGGTLTGQNQGVPDSPKPAAIENAIKIRAVSSADHTLGNPSAPLALVVYTDTECPFCKTFHNTVKQVVDIYGKDGKILVAYRHFPLLQIHPRAQKEAEATECAAELGGKTAFWDFVDEIFKVTPSNNQLDPAELPKIASRIGLDKTALVTFNECLSGGKFEEKVSADLEEGISAGGRGTPFSIFIVSKPLNQINIQTIEEINSGFVQQGSSEPFTISTDKKRVAMSGALPLAYVQRIVDLLLAN